ncbi:hypothetical protein NEHOM01_0019 [Nematocida homosporus]|uniref:uncharacterized protein n=1 Tax=Nematocida homosporus TaxID=1912981 RepID=UPI00221FEDDF|nr:uncharacterized protein NEHOM01_0019 [Nematocida homosporus]KAI5184274.1 hypothetical protein NEHOM01_0019 [Nematocida homosporus]
MDTHDLLVQELHAKDQKITEVLELERLQRVKVLELTTRIGELTKILDNTTSDLRAAEKKIKRQELSNRQLERKCAVQIRRLKQTKSLSPDEKERRILVLEWIIQQLGDYYYFPSQEVLALAEISDPNDSILTQLIKPLHTRSETPSNPLISSTPTPPTPTTTPNPAIIPPPDQTSTHPNPIHPNPIHPNPDLLTRLDENGIQSILDIPIDNLDKSRLN